MLLPIADLLRDAVSAAADIRRSAVTIHSATTLPAAQLAAEASGMQTRFESVAPVLRHAMTSPEDAAEVQAAAVDRYGRRAPGDVVGLILTAQAAGASAVEAIRDVIGDEVATLVWHEPSGRYLPINLAGTDLDPLRAPMAALIAALDPISG